MKASVYAVETIHGLRRVVPTIHFATDLAVWLAKPEVRGIRLLCKEISWREAWQRAALSQTKKDNRSGQNRREAAAPRSECGREMDADAGNSSVWYSASNVPLGKLGGLTRKHFVTCRKMAGLLQGRSLFPEEFQRLLMEHDFAEEAAEWTRWAQLLYLTGAIRLECGICENRVGGNGAALPTYRRPYRWIRWTKHRSEPYCQRCGSSGGELERTPCAACGEECWYCKGCLTMGRSRGCSVLIIGNELPLTQRLQEGGGHPKRSLEAWGLSPAQTEAVKKGLCFLERTASSRTAREREERFLIWAVTGAGKTEMIYPLIESVLSDGGRVAVATPRRDVVLELSPRMKKAFPDTRIATLYGGSDEGWTKAGLTLATTHQLIRFEHAFDLVIIDELDAFPYHNDPKLAYAARKSLKGGGKMIYLSATPPKELQQQVKQGRVDHVRVPVRFHRYPLPVPKHYSIPAVKQWCGSGRVPEALRKLLRASLEREAQVFVFVAAIRLIEPVVTSLRRVFPQIQVEGTSSMDTGRGEKVIQFRESKTRMLVTTTILERGVTIPKSDVFILDADSSLFDEASLVQMAGRAGRSKVDPQGRVYFFSSARTRSQKGAIRQIEHMNKLAAKKGYLRNEDT